MHRTGIYRRSRLAPVQAVATLALAASWYAHWMIQTGVTIVILYALAGRLSPNRDFFIDDGRNLFFSLSKRSTVLVFVCLVFAVPVAYFESSSGLPLTRFDIDSWVNGHSLFRILQNLVKDPDLLQGMMFLPRSALFAFSSSVLLVHYALNARSYVYAPKPWGMLLGLAIFFPACLILFAVAARTRDYAPLALNIVIIFEIVSVTMYWLIYPFRDRL